MSHLHKTYGPTVAVDDVSFSVRKGEIFGVIGPNGAGKTTAVECVGGLRNPDRGSISVLGLDPCRHGPLRQVVGVQLQEGSMPVRLKVDELVELFASFYPHPADTGQLLDLLDLAPKRHAYYGRLSGGQKQRVAIALALVGNPKLAILDELTTGLDPQARRDTWELVAGIRDRGVTVVLVTHFMDEAERLCDRVMLVDHGQVVALDTPAMLAERHGGTRLSFHPSQPFDYSLLTRLSEVSGLQHKDGRVVVTGTGDVLGAVVHALDGVGVEPGECRPHHRQSRGRLPPAHSASKNKLSTGGVTMTSIDTITVPRPTGRSLRRLIATETKLAYRVPVGVVLGVVVPVLLLVIFGVSPGFKKPVNPHTTITFMDDYVPVLMALTLALIGLVSLPIPMVMNRERKYLRRLSATPVAPVWLLAAEVAVNLVLAVVAMGLIVGGGVLFFNIKAPGDLGGFILAAVLADCIPGFRSRSAFIVAVSPSPPVLRCLRHGGAVPAAVLRRVVGPPPEHGSYDPPHWRLHPPRLRRAITARRVARHLSANPRARGHGRLGAGLLGGRGQTLPLGVVVTSTLTDSSAWRW